MQNHIELTRLASSQPLSSNSMNLVISPAFVSCHVTQSTLVMYQLHHQTSQPLLSTSTSSNRAWLLQMRCHRFAVLLSLVGLQLLLGENEGSRRMVGAAIMQEGLQDVTELALSHGPNAFHTFPLKRILKGWLCCLCCLCCLFLTLLTLLPLLSLLILLTLLTLLTCQSFLVTASQVFPKFQVTCTSGSVPRLQPSVDCMAIMRNRWARTSPGLQGSRWEGYRVSDQETGLPEISTSQYRDESWWIMIQQISPNILKQILNRQHIFPARWRSDCVLGDSLAPQRAPAPRQSPAATGPGTSGTGSSEPAAGGVSLGACFLKTRLSPGWVVKHLLSSCWATGIFLEFCDLDMTQSLAADPWKDCWKHVLRWCSYIFIIFVRPWESGHRSELRKLQPRLGSSGVQQSDQLWQPQGDHHQY